MEALNESLRPAITDIEISWHLPEGYDVIQSPSQVPFVFDGERLVLYGLLSRPPSEEKESPRTPQRRRMDRTMRSFSNNSVKVFWFDDDMEYLPEEQLLLEIEEQERQADDGHGHIFQTEQELDFQNFIDPLGVNTDKNNDTQENMESIDYLRMRARSASPRGNHSAVTSSSHDHAKDMDARVDERRTTSSSDSSGRHRSYSSSVIDENDVVHNIVFGDFFKDVTNSSESVFTKANDNGSQQQQETKDVAHQTDAQSKRNQYALEKEGDIGVGRKKSSSKTSNRSPENEDENIDYTSACDSKEIADQQTSRYHERDSGVGFSMDDSDKPFEEDPSSNALNSEEEKSEIRPPTEGTTPTHEDLEFPDFKLYTVVKNSDMLGQLGLPKNFGAVSIKGCVGDEELEQVMKKRTFYNHHSPYGALPLALPLYYTHYTTFNLHADFY